MVRGMAKRRRDKFFSPDPLQEKVEARRRLKWE